MSVSATNPSEHERARASRASGHAVRYTVETDKTRDEEVAAGLKEEAINVGSGKSIVPLSVGVSRGKAVRYDKHFAVHAVAQTPVSQ